MQRLHSSTKVLGFTLPYVKESTPHRRQCDYLTHTDRSQYRNSLEKTLEKEIWIKKVN